MRFGYHPSALAERLNDQLADQLYFPGKMGYLSRRKSGRIGRRVTPRTEQFRPGHFDTREPFSVHFQSQWPAPGHICSREKRP